MRLLRSVAGKTMIIVSLAIFVVLWGAMAWMSMDHEGRPLTTLNPRGEYAQMIDDLVAPVFLIAGVIFVAVLGAVAYIAVRYREKDPDDELDLPKQTHGHTPLELGWTIAPAAILAVVAFLTVLTIIDLERDEDDALHVEVFGQQWWWGFRYDVNGDGSFDGPEDVETATELVIPVGRPVQLHITSNDVIHSFWIPALNGKKDAVPGMHSDWKIQADEPGVFRGQCTEFCGLAHADMRMLVRAVPHDEFDEWLEGQQQPAQDPPPDNELAVAGQEVFVTQCASCHLVEGLNDDMLVDGETDALVAGVAPNLTHFRSRGTFSGSIFNLTYPDPEGMDEQPFGATCAVEALEECGDPTDVSRAGNPDNPLYRADLEDWLRDPSAMKPMAADEQRGMPNLGLSEEQIDQLVAYLETLE